MQRPGHCNKVGVPSGGAPFIFPALGTALHHAPAPCRHCHLQAAAPGPALGLCQQQEHSTVTPEGSSNPTPTVTHTQQDCTLHPLLAAAHQGREPHPCTHMCSPSPGSSELSCWLTRGETSSGFSAPSSRQWDQSN